MPDQTQNLLQRYHDRELSGADRQAVEAHLATCAECREELAGLQALSAAVARLPAPVYLPDAASFWQDVQPRLGAQLRPRRAWLAWLPGIVLLLLKTLTVVLGLLSTGAWLLRSGFGLPGTGAFAWGFRIPEFVQPGGPFTAVLDVLSKDLGEPAGRALALAGGLWQAALIAGALSLLYLGWLAAWYPRHAK